MLAGLKSAINDNEFLHHIYKLFRRYEKIALEIKKNNIIWVYGKKVEKFENNNVYWCFKCRSYSNEKCHDAELFPVFRALFPFAEYEGFIKITITLRLPQIPIIVIPMSVKVNYMTNLKKINNKTFHADLIIYYGEGHDLEYKSLEFCEAFFDFIYENKMNNTNHVVAIYNQCCNNYPKFKMFLLNEIAKNSILLRKLKMR